MKELCINTHGTMEPGQIHSGEVFAEAGEMFIAVKCIRRVTKEEYLKFVEEQKLMHMVKRSINDPYLNFYLVEVLD